MFLYGIANTFFLTWGPVSVGNTKDLIHVVSRPQKDEPNKIIVLLTYNKTYLKCQVNVTRKKID